MLSNELLSAVLGEEVMIFVGNTSLNPDRNMIVYRKISGSKTRIKAINIYELAHKCKEWIVKEKGYIFSKLINCGLYTQYQVVYKQPKTEHEFLADTEPEAIFKACEWILENAKAK